MFCIRLLQSSEIPSHSSDGDTEKAVVKSLRLTLFWLFCIIGLRVLEFALIAPEGADDSYEGCLAAMELSVFVSLMKSPRVGIPS